MINLGRYSGADLPNVRIQPRLLDWVMEAISVLVWISLLCITFLYRQEISGMGGGKNFILPGISTLITLLFLWSARAPIRYFNFPVRVTERNYVTQLILAVRFCRVVSIQLNITFLLRFLADCVVQDEVVKRYLHGCSATLIVLLLVSFIIYFLIARRYPA